MVGRSAISRKVLRPGNPHRRELRRLRNDALTCRSETYCFMVGCWVDLRHLSEWVRNNVVRAEAPTETGSEFSRLWDNESFHPLVEIPLLRPCCTLSLRA